MQFQILGPLRVTDRNGRDVPLAGARPRAVLALLILHANEVVSSDRLAEDLWEGRPPRTAAKALQVYVSRLRHALAGAGAYPVATRGGGYVLEVEPNDVDALRFERLVTEGAAALAANAPARASPILREALKLWRGDPLTDFPYASFAQDPIMRLEELRTVAVERAVEAELALGRSAELLPELKMLVARDPLNEHLRAELMLALARSGRQAEALGEYRAARRILIDELGLEPGSELRALESAILAQEDDVSRARVHPVMTPRGAFVGYGQVLRELEETIGAAFAGRTRIVLIAGEPGIGKTRLAEELSAIACSRGAQVLWGAALELGVAPPFWPWTQALRGLGTQLEQLTVGEQGRAARFYLFDRICALLAESASAQPLVIVLDDLHVADPSSLALLEFAATTMRTSPLMVVGTYRDTEVGPDDPLNATLNVLTRVNDCLQLSLTGLTRADTTRFVELSAGIAPLDALAAAIHEVTGGNPLFVTELVRLLRAEGRLEELEPGEALVLPRGISQVLARRVGNLSDPCRQVLAFGAVIGREFELPILERVADSSGEEVLALLGEATAARVLDERDHGRLFRFSHDLVRESLYRSLTPLERARAHAAVADALERLHPTDSTGLAHHCERALPVGDATQALRYLELAGDGAAELSASHEAADAYERAVQVARAGATDAGKLCEICVKLAEQLILIPEPARAQQALAEADALGPSAPQRARIAIVGAQLDIFFGAQAVGRGGIEQAIALLRDRGEAHAEARGWWALFMWDFVARGDFTAADTAAQQMLACARRAGSRELIGEAVRAAATAIAYAPGPISSAVSTLRDLLSEDHDVLTRARLLVLLAELEATRGHFSDARTSIARAREAVAPAQLEDVDWSGGIPVSKLELLAGNAVAAEQHSRAECARDRRRGLVGYLASDLTYLAQALIEQGRLDEADTELGRAATVTMETDADALLRQARCKALIELARGDASAAEASTRTALRYGERIHSTEIRAETLLLLAQVLTAAGKAIEASAAAREALVLSEAREHEVFASRARAVLAGTEAQAAAII